MRDDNAFAAADGAPHRLSSRFRSATHIVKLWEPNDYDQLAANEYFCLRAARRCGLEVPPVRLAEDGAALVIDRFDLRVDGAHRGFEDFCVLNARRTGEKYRGSYETHVMKRFAQFANSTQVHGDTEKLFLLIALNCAPRNGDAHLKNFGIVYDDVLGEARLAPVYDLATTSVYLRNDGLALTLNGATRWPTPKNLQRLGETRGGGTPGKVKRILERTAQAIHETGREVRSYMKHHAEFAEVGKRMLAEWDSGVHGSLRGRKASFLDGISVWSQAMSFMSPKERCATSCASIARKKLLN